MIEVKRLVHSDRIGRIEILFFPDEPNKPPAGKIWDIEAEREYYFLFVSIYIIV